MKGAVSGTREMIAGMDPRLDPARWIFTVLPSGTPMPLPPDDPALAGLVCEAEGTTLIVEAQAAERAGLSPVFEAERITLMVHSDLEGVGLTAAVSAALAEEGISCNVVAGAYHDHLYVPSGSGAQAMAALRRLRGEGLA